MPDPTDPRLAAALRRLDRGTAQFVSQIAPIPPWGKQLRTSFMSTTHPEQMFRGSWINLTITERFTRVREDRLLYRFTVEDPTKWEQPWGGEYEFRPSSGPIEEYACREGEVSLPAMLLGARRAEAAEAAKNGKSK